MSLGAAALVVLGLFGRGKKPTDDDGDPDLMPPPPPFPSLDEELGEEEKSSEPKAKQKKSSGKKKASKKKTTKSSKAKKKGAKKKAPKRRNARKSPSSAAKKKGPTKKSSAKKKKSAGKRKTASRKTKDDFQSTLPDTLEVAGISDTSKAEKHEATGREAFASFDEESSEDAESVSSWESERSEYEIERAIDTIQHRKHKKSFAERLNAVLGPKKKTPRESLTATSQADNPTDRIMEMVEAAREQLMDLNLEGAKATYIEIMKLYNTLSLEDQKRVYMSVRDLYEERRNAESIHFG